MKTSLILAVVFAFVAWIGGIQLHQMMELSFILYTLFLAMAAGLAVRLLTWLNWERGGIVIIALMVFIAYITGTITKYWYSDLSSYKVTQNIPVKLERVTHNGKFTGSVKLINTSTDMMLAARAQCVLAYDNGQPIDVTFAGGIGQGPVQFMPGQGETTLLVHSSDWKKFRTDPNTANCFVTSAQFVKRPLFLSNVSVVWGPHADRKNDFMVTNNGTAPIKNVQFQCVTEDGQNRKVLAYPSYLTDITKDTVIGVGETVKFTEKTNTTWVYKACVVSNAVAL